MLTETVVIFSVLLGLMILISVLGGSILPLENFGDEVVSEEPIHEETDMLAQARSLADMDEKDMKEKLDMMEPDTKAKMMEALEKLGVKMTSEEKPKKATQEKEAFMQHGHKDKAAMKGSGYHHKDFHSNHMKGGGAHKEGHMKEPFMGHGHKEGHMKGSGYGHKDAHMKGSGYGHKEAHMKGSGYGHKDAHAHKNHHMKGGGGKMHHTVEPFDGELYASF